MPTPPIDADALLKIAERYPPAPTGKFTITLGNRRNWAERIAHDIELVTNRIGTTGTICDAGGGLGLFAIGCSLVGMRSVLIEDFYDIERIGMLDTALGLLDDYGVEYQRRDIIADGLTFSPGELDAAVSFHVLEHLPLSPNALFRQMRDAVRPGGVVLIAGPNAVNLRKRIAVPLGKGAWSPMEDWYESERFRGHVREPTVEDLRYIARDLGLEKVAIHGANFLGTASTQPWRRRLTRLADRGLRKRPSLCSDIYLVGQRARCAET